jgi:Gram-negative bacterial TonB protein C-terminal
MRMRGPRAGISAICIRSSEVTSEVPVLPISIMLKSITPEGIIGKWALALLLFTGPAVAQDTAAASHAPCKLQSHEHRTTVAMAFRYQPFAPLDPTWARAVFDSVAGQWPHPPFKHERTDLSFILRKDSALKTYHVLHSSGNKDFDLIAARALALAAVGHKIPPFPASYLGDSVTFTIMFGDLADYMDSIYANTDRQAPQPWASNEKPKWPAGWTVTGGTTAVIAEFEIDSVGHVDPMTIRISQAPNDDFAAQVRTVIPNWRFTPAMEHCRPVRSTYRFTATFGR